MINARFALMGLLVALRLAGAQGLTIGLEVRNAGNEARFAEPVSFGVPFPATAPPVTSPGQIGLHVVGPFGGAVPAQFRVLARWNGPRDDATRAIKWLLVSFRASALANATTTYQLVSQGSNPPGLMTLADAASQIVVSPRPGAVFVLDKTAFRLFKLVWIDGATIVGAPGGGLELLATSGQLVPPTVDETAVEEAGTVRTVVRQRGTLGGLTWTARYLFHSGRTDVTLDFRLENPGAYGLFQGALSEHRYFDALELQLPVAWSGLFAATPSDMRWLGAATYDLRQDFSWGANPLDALSSFTWTEKVGAQQVAAGHRHPGAIDLSGPQGGVTVVVDRFWENFPKSLKISAGRLHVGLWPEWGHGPEFAGQYGAPGGPAAAIDPLALQHYRFEGGRWKTHRMVFDFHTGIRLPAAVTSVAERVRRPLAGRPRPRWTKFSGAVSTLFSERRPWVELSSQRYERMGDVMHDDQLATPLPGLGKIGLRRFRNRGGTFGGRQFYGWSTFGDIVWGEGASSLHYDWVLSMLLRWYRGGGYGYFDLGRDMAWHLRDYDTNHSGAAGESWRGAAFYEKGWWHGNFLRGDVAHTWVHGLLLHYVTTGEEASYEGALETRDFLLRHPPRNWDGRGGARVPGRAIENLLQCWDYLGTPACLVEARAGIERFEALEQSWGGGGYVLNPLTATGSVPVRCQPWMHAILFNAVSRYTLASGDPSFRPLLARMLGWFVNDCIQWNGGTPQAWLLPSVHGFWAPGGHSAQDSFHLLWPLQESLSRAWLVFGDPADFGRSALLFELLTRFHQLGPGTTVDLTSTAGHSPIGMRMTAYPDSESKIAGNYLRWGLTHQAVRSIFLGTWFQ